MWALTAGTIHCSFTGCPRTWKRRKSLLRVVHYALISCLLSTLILTMVVFDRICKVLFPYSGSKIWWMCHTGDLYPRPHVNIQNGPLLASHNACRLRKSLVCQYDPLLECWTIPDWSPGSINCLWLEWHGRCMVEVLYPAPLLWHEENHFDPNRSALKQCRTNQRQHIGKKNAGEQCVLEDVLARWP